jgi:hypothetical protein
MKITVILRQDGTLIGTARETAERSDVQAVLRPRAGHTLHEIEVPDDYAGLAPTELHERIRTIHLREHCR